MAVAAAGVAVGSLLGYLPSHITALALDGGKAKAAAAAFPTGRLLLLLGLGWKNGGSGGGAVSAADSSEDPDSDPFLVPAFDKDNFFSVFFFFNFNL